MALALAIFYLTGLLVTAWCSANPALSRAPGSFFRFSDLIWPLTMTVFALLFLVALLAHWCSKLAAALTDRRADSLQGGAAVDIRSRFPNSHLILAAVLASSLLQSGFVVPQGQALACETRVVTSAADEFVRSRRRAELPRILTWRPLPVAMPELHLRASPHAALKSAPR